MLLVTALRSRCVRYRSHMAPHAIGVHTATHVSQRRCRLHRRGFITHTSLHCFAHARTHTGHAGSDTSLCVCLSGILPIPFPHPNTNPNYTQLLAVADRNVLAARYDSLGPVHAPALQGVAYLRLRLANEDLKKLPLTPTPYYAYPCTFAYIHPHTAVGYTAVG